MILSNVIHVNIKWFYFSPTTLYYELKFVLFIDSIAHSTEEVVMLRKKKLFSSIMVSFWHRTFVSSTVSLCVVSASTSHYSCLVFYVSNNFIIFFKTTKVTKKKSNLIYFQNFGIYLSLAISLPTTSPPGFILSVI